MRTVEVVAAALIDADGRVMVAQRPEGKSLAGLWEFPGGKIEPGETPEAALVRELAEELDITVPAEALQPLTFVSHAYADFHLLMLLYVCRSWQGVPNGLQGQPLRWGTSAELAALPMPPADVPLLAALRALERG
jgi:8-oxo-dGTP diphosphatase